MPIGDPPPWPWNDAIGYLPWWSVLPLPMEPLGEPFQTVLFDNLWDLYARDQTPLWFWAEIPPLH